jgi:hypothetical protein
MAFKEIKAGSTQYAKPALYFYAHISYVRSALQEALEGFQALVEFMREFERRA